MRAPLSWAVVIRPAVFQRRSGRLDRVVDAKVEEGRERLIFVNRARAQLKLFDNRREKR